MKAITAVRVFLASPMDIVEERQVFRNALQKVNNAIGRNLGIYFEVIGWEDYVLPGVGIDAQDVVNKQIKQEYDVFVGLFKSRIGTKTHRAISGTVEEYELAQMKRISCPELQIMCYYFDSPGCENEEIQNLKQRMNNDGVLYTQVPQPDLFEEMVFNHFSKMLLQFAQKYRSVNGMSGRFKKDRSVAVAIIIDEKVILVKRSAASTVGVGLWQIPGGKVDENETPLNAAQREIREELNLNIDKEGLVCISDIKTRNIKNNNEMDLLLYIYHGDETLLPQIALNSENDECELVSISNVMFDNRIYLGYNKQLMTILWRELYLSGPLDALLKQIKASSYEGIPSSISLYPKYDSNVLYSVLSVMGFIHFNPKPVFSSSYSERIIEEIISLSRNNIPLFENTNVDTLRDLQLPDNEFPTLQMHREKMLFSHKSLMSILSCKAPLKNSVRNVTDILIFGEYMGKKYMLLRWDFYAEKYQLISGGINIQEYPSKEEKAAAIISRRFSETMIHFFDYHEMTHIETQHFSAGSVENDPILRKYDVDIIVATPKEPEKANFIEFVDTINSATELSIEYCWDISSEQTKKLNHFHWCLLDDLLSSSTTYGGRKVQGLQEIIAAVGRQTILEFSKRSIHLSERDVNYDIDVLIKDVKAKLNRASE